MLVSWSFTRQIGLAAAALTLGTLLIVSSVSYYAMRELMLHNLKASLEHSADLLSRQLYNQLNALLDTSLNVAHNSLVGNAVVDDEGRQRYLNDFLKNFSSIADVPVNLVVTDFQGTPYGSSKSVDLLIDAEWVSAAVANNQLLQRHVEQQGVHYLIYAIPVIFPNTGLPEGALVMQVALNEILPHQQIDSILRIQEEFQRTTPAIQIHMSSPDGEYTGMYHGNINYAPNLSVNVTMPTLVELPDWRFTITLRTHSRFFSKPLNHLLLAYLVLGTLLIGLVLSLSRFLAMFLTRRLRLLEQDARHLAQEKSVGGRLNISGNDEVSHLATAFNQVLAKLETAYAEQQHAKAADAANRAKSAFIANMSHELRTPLNAVLGFAQILSHDTMLSDEQHHQILSIKRGGEYLLSLINDVLDMAKIEAGHFELAATNWYTEVLFSSLQDIFKIRAQQKGIAFYYKPLNNLPAELNCDEKRLRQILMNLLANAIKFTEQGSVTFRVGIAGNNLIMEIEDTGIGIANEHLDYIFQPFSQVSDELHKQQGTGLGLAITNKLVDAMRGDLSVQSVPQQGSCFRLRIPVTPVAGHAYEAEVKPRISGYQRTGGLDTPLKILVADDVPESREILRHPLAQLGFELQEAQDGEQVLVLAQRWRPDLILLDLRMPKLDGLGVARCLCAQPETANIPIIAVSASAFSADRQQAQDAGCKNFLPKPVNMPILLNLLSDYLPLNWLYAHPKLAPEPTNPTPLPADLREQLLQILQKGQIAQLIKILDSLSQQADASDEIREMTKLAKHFELNALRHRLQKLT